MRTRKPKTYAEYKAREDQKRKDREELEKAMPGHAFIDVLGPPPSMLEQFFACRYQGMQRREIEKLLDQAYDTPES